MPRPDIGAKDQNHCKNKSWGKSTAPGPRNMCGSPWAPFHHLPPEGEYKLGKCKWGRQAKAGGWDRQQLDCLIFFFWGGGVSNFFFFMAKPDDIQFT